MLNLISLLALQQANLFCLNQKPAFFIPLFSEHEIVLSLLSLKSQSVTMNQNHFPGVSRLMSSNGQKDKSWIDAVVFSTQVTVQIKLQYVYYINWSFFLHRAGNSNI